MKQNEELQNRILYFLGIFPTIWLALIIAPNLNTGLINIIKEFTNSMNNPLKIYWCTNSIKSILIFLLIYIMIIVIYESTKKNYRRGEEHGSAKWGIASQLNKKYMQKPDNMNKILTKNVRLGLNGKKHKRNLNVLVIGGSGAGKTFSYCKPNVMQCNTSMVILDPKGEIIRDTGYLLEEKGYEVRVLDLINMDKSHCYNPFVYLKNDNDVQNFDKILSVMRSREVSVSIILQNLAQLKALFEKQWESIVGNCDEFLYLGGNEQSTHKYVSELLGKETIDMNTYGKSSGRSGNYSINYQNSGRELLTPDEVRMLNNKYALLFFRGERPVQDLKFNLFEHKNIELSGLGKAKPYLHGGNENAIASFQIDYEDYDIAKNVEDIDSNYELLSDEELKKYIMEELKNE